MCCWLQVVQIYTDGSCWPNPGGPGGWASILTFQSKACLELSGYLPPPCTNNRAELTGAIKALESLGEVVYSVDLYTDSQYLKNGATAWKEKWLKRSWKNVKNADLWQELDRLQAKHKVCWHWVRGHQNKGGANDRADFLADQARQMKGSHESRQHH